MQIKDLKRAVSNMSGDNYSINGVTYDDGSNIADAIRTIAHAAKNRKEELMASVTKFKSSFSE
mgnify:CR=1 FL=1